MIDDRIQQLAGKQGFTALKDRRDGLWYFANQYNFLKSPETGLDDEEALEYLMQAESSEEPVDDETDCDITPQQQGEVTMNSETRTLERERRIEAAEQYWLQHKEPWARERYLDRRSADADETWSIWDDSDREEYEDQEAFFDEAREQAESEWEEWARDGELERYLESVTAALDEEERQAEYAENPEAFGETVWVRRQWNDCRIGKVLLDDISGLHWTDESGGVRARAPRPFLHGYIMCDRILEGEISHSCSHGYGPHEIKVCIVKKDNPGTFEHLMQNRVMADLGVLTEQRKADRPNASGKKIKGKRISVIYILACSYGIQDLERTLAEVGGRVSSDRRSEQDDFAIQILECACFARREFDKLSPRYGGSNTRIHTYATQAYEKLWKDRRAA